MSPEEKKELQKKYLFPPAGVLWSEEERLKRLEEYQKEIEKAYPKKTKKKQ